MRPRGGYIGFNRVPAASAANSAASGVWTLREAEALKRAGTWPTVGGPLIVFSNFYTSGGSASSEYSVSGLGASGSQLVATVGGNDDNDNRLWLLINQSGTLTWSVAMSSESGYDYGYLYRTTGTPTQHGVAQQVPATSTTLVNALSGSATASGTLSVTANQHLVVIYIKDNAVSSGTDNVTLTASIA